MIVAGRQTTKGSGLRSVRGRSGGAILFAAALASAVLCCQRVCASDLEAIVGQIETHAARLHSARGRLVITREQTAEFRRALQISPDAQVERRVEADWAFKGGKRWFRGKGWVGDHVSDQTFVYDGKRSFQTEAFRRNSRMRGAIFAGEAPLEPCPLDFGWFVERRPMAGVLRRGEFRVAGRMADARHGRLIRIEGREWPPNPARTVVFIAEERGFLPVRVERYVPNSRTPLTVLETVRTQKLGSVWFPVAVRQETRYAGTQTTELTTTDVRVNEVEDSLFAVAWTKPGDVWNNGTNTALHIDPGGQLSLDSRMGRLGVRVDRPMLLRTAVAAIMFVGLGILVLSAVRVLRKATRLIGS